MNKAQILFVGDYDKSFLKQINNENWEIKHKTTSVEALDLLEREKISLIIAKDKIARDKIEDINGYQLCLLIKSSPNTYNLPFYILGEKKRSSTMVGSVFARPNRIAEYNEVMNKPQSLVKLIKEDLKDLSKDIKKDINQDGFQAQFFPACRAAELRSDPLNEINSELLLERSVSTRMMGLLRWPTAKSQYLSDCFSTLNDIVKADLCGIEISSLHKPWMAFSGNKALNQKSFESLVAKVKDNIVFAQEANTSLLLSPPLVETGASIISDAVILSIVNDGSTSGKLIFAKYDNQKFSSLERVIISYVERFAKPLFEFLIAEQLMDKALSREAVRASVDPLTGLYNLEFLVGFLQQQLLFSFRNKLAVSLLMIDIDRFSQINDALGPAVADTILVKLSEKLLSIIRGSDLLARYNSDKFVIVLPNTPLKGAKVVAEKICLEIQQTNFFVGRQPGPGVTISVGAAEYDPHDLNPESILKEAKIALQKAKESGRNKVAL